MSFQENLKYYREKAGYKTAKELADALNLPYNTYAGYESKNREPKYQMLCKIADLLNVSIDELLGRKNNILGNNEDERLEKEIDNVLSHGLLGDVFSGLNPIELKLINILKEDITFQIHTDKSNQTLNIPKMKIIEGFNNIDDDFRRRKKVEKEKYIYSQILERIDILRKATDTTQKEINSLIDIAFKIYQYKFPELLKLINK